MENRRRGLQPTLKKDPTTLATINMALDTCEVCASNTHKTQYCTVEIKNNMAKLESTIEKLMNKIESPKPENQEINLANTQSKPPNTTKYFCQNHPDSGTHNTDQCRAGRNPQARPNQNPFRNSNQQYPRNTNPNFNQNNQTSHTQKFLQNTNQQNRRQPNPNKFNNYKYPNNNNNYRQYTHPNQHNFHSPMQQQYTNQSYYHRQNRYQNSTNGIKICYFCNDPSHLIQNCPKYILARAQALSESENSWPALTNGVTGTGQQQQQTPQISHQAHPTVFYPQA